MFKIKSIRIELIFLLSFSAFLALGLSSIVMYNHIYNMTKVQNIQSLSKLVNILSKNLLASVEFSDVDSAKTLLRTLEIDKSIDGAFILTAKNKYFASFNRNSNNDLKKRLDKLYTSDNITKSINFIGNKYIIVSMPLLLDNEYIATFCIVSNTKELDQEILNLIKKQAYISLFSLLAIFFIATFIQKRFTKPIYLLIDAMKKIVHNEEVDLLECSSKNEFLYLFNGFNVMNRTIKSQTKDLQNQLREAKIAEKKQLKYIQEIKNIKLELEDINKHTRESIEYAGLIQSALIPDNRTFKKYFKDYFAIWHPKDTVGGDIYLFEELRNNDECLLMVIDCTGHGVPGAFVTMLVKAIERQITSKIKFSDEIVSPAKILSIFNRNMRELLKQENDISISNAGFDGQVLYYNKKDKIMKCASARNEIFYYQDDELKVIKGDRHSVGYKDSDVNYEFSEHIIDLSKETTMYISTDGFWDQNGGEKDLPYGKKRLKRMLDEIHNESMADQQEEFLYAFEDYRGDHITNDDVTVIGLRI